MKIISELSELIEDEIHDAERYATMALHYEDSDTELSRLYLELSKEELDNHAGKLHDMVASKIKAYREKNGAPPADMQAVYDYLHERHVQKAAEVKSMQNMHKR